jgi:hypothetical protein
MLANQASFFILQILKKYETSYKYNRITYQEIFGKREGE